MKVDSRRRKRRELKVDFLIDEGALGADDPSPSSGPGPVSTSADETIGSGTTSTPETTTNAIPAAPAPLVEELTEVENQTLSDDTDSDDDGYYSGHSDAFDLGIDESEIPDPPVHNDNGEFEDSDYEPYDADPEFSNDKLDGPTDMEIDNDTTASNEEPPATPVRQILQRQTSPPALMRGGSRGGLRRSTRTP